jgi:glycogen debranching enzyme
MIFETVVPELDADLETFCSQRVSDALIELNVVLYCVEDKKRNWTSSQIGAYEIFGLGKLVYCGLEGWMYPAQPHHTTQRPRSPPLRAPPRRHAGV